MAIITPMPMPHTGAKSHKDLDVDSRDLLMPTRDDDWPSPQRIKRAQDVAAVSSEHIDATREVDLYVNVEGRIIIPEDSDITNEIVAMCHQGNHMHRSSKETVDEFQRHFTIQGMNKKQERKYLHKRCRHCLSCIKTKTGALIPRPLWYMAYATRPFEYIHLDFVELPDATDDKRYVLVITDDFSLTTVLWATKHNDAEAVAHALLQGWLSHYPDCDLIHSNGGSHFCNQVIKKLTEKRGWKHTVCTPHSKWANGVAERNIRSMKDILVQLCLSLIHI